MTALAVLPAALLLASGAAAQTAPVRATAVVQPAPVFAPTRAQAAMLERARRGGGKDLVATAGPDGGMILNGTIEGRRFVLGLPIGWNGEIALFGQGYGTPGSTPTVPADPLTEDPSGGTFRHLYGKDIAFGIAAFDKSGVATQSGALNAMRLRALSGKMGARRFYALGGSMGGSIVMTLIERHAPGLRASVLGSHVMSPLDLARENINLVGGDSLSGSHHLDQFFLFRPAPGRSRWRTGIDGLFHVGASTWPGAGTGAGSGYMLARELAA